MRTSRWIFVLGLLACAIVASLLMRTRVEAQSELVFQMVQGRPPLEVYPVPIAAGSGGAATWTATTQWTGGSNSAIRLNAEKGTAPAVLQVGIIDWAVQGLKPGKYTGGVTLKFDNGETRQIPISVNVAAELPRPKYTYVQGPNGCSNPGGYDDESVCAIPNQKPGGGTFTPPPMGGNYVDPVFGANIRMIAGPVARHAYSNPSPISAGNKYAMIIEPGGGNDAVHIIELRTGKAVHKNIEANVVAGTFWDATDPEVYYWIEGTRVRKRDLKNKRTTTLEDFGRREYGFTTISTGGTGDASKDNWIAFQAPEQKKICAFDMGRQQSYCGSWDGLPLTMNGVDHVLITRGIDKPTGKRYVLAMGKPADAIFSVDTVNRTLKLEYQGPEDVQRGGNGDGVCDPGEACLRDTHEETFEDENGVQYVMLPWEFIKPCEYDVIMLQLNKGRDVLKPVELGGGMRVVKRLFACGTRWTDVHVGCAKTAPYCVISTIDNDRRKNPADQTPIPATPHYAEIMVTRGAGQEVRRLMHHRSVIFTNEEASGYWSTPRAAISNDGSLVMATSNFGVPNEQRVFTIETGYGKPTIDRVANAASFGDLIAPGSILSIFGYNLSNCRQSPPSYPLATTMCGSQVKVNNTEAYLLYAGWEQLNALVPPTVRAGTELSVVVMRDGEPSEVANSPPENVRDAAPAFFTYKLDDGVARAVVQNAEGSVSGPQNPLVPGQAAVLYLTGLGPTDPDVPPQSAAPAEPLARAIKQIAVYINDVAQAVSFAGLTPGLSGVFQVNITVSAETPVSSENWIWVEVDGVSSERLGVSLRASGA